MDRSPLKYSGYLISSFSSSTESMPTLFPATAHTTPPLATTHCCPFSSLLRHNQWTCYLFVCSSSTSTTHPQAFSCSTVIAAFYYTPSPFVRGHPPRTATISCRHCSLRPRSLLSGGCSSSCGETGGR